MRCFVCGSEMREEYTTYTTEKNNNVIIVHNVPAHICRSCGESVFHIDVSRQLTKIINETQSVDKVTIVNYKEFTNKVLTL